MKDSFEHIVMQRRKRFIFSMDLIWAKQKRARLYWSNRL